MTSQAPGALVVVGTPIGNLGDLSPRAREALSTADAVACEDTRRTGRLLQLAGLPKRPLIVVNEHTEFGRAAHVVDRVAAGERIVLVSDAGMPSVSDPGRIVVAAVADAGLPVDIVPGPTAAVSALVLSGLGDGRFVFEGFLERRGAGRAAQLREIGEQTRATVLYESPNRVLKTLGDLVEACGPTRRVAVVRELTKLHETVVRGPLADVAAVLGDEAARGEYVIVVDGADVTPVERTDAELLALVDDAVAGGATTRDAVDAVAASTGVARRRIYEVTHGPRPEFG